MADPSKGPAIPKPSRTPSPSSGSTPPRIPTQPVATPPAQQEPAAQEPAASEDEAEQEGVAEPSVNHWSTKDEEMSSIAARALGRGPGEREPAPEEPQRSSLRRRLQGRSEPEPEVAQEEPQAEPEAATSESGFEDDPLASAYPDPLASESESADDFASEATPFDEDYEADYSSEDYDEEESRFEYRAPFTGRRNPMKMWTLAAVIFALLAGGTAIAVNYVGLPEWLPFNRPSFGIGKPDLVLNFPAADQREEPLETGETIFRVRGSINNAGSTSVSVPQLVVVFVDETDREIFSKVIVPSKSELAPGESLMVTEGISGYPAQANKARIGWAPN